MLQSCKLSQYYNLLFQKKIGLYYIGLLWPKIAMAVRCVDINCHTTAKYIFFFVCHVRIQNWRSDQIYNTIYAISPIVCSFINLLLLLIILLQSKSDISKALTYSLSRPKIIPFLTPSAPYLNSFLQHYRVRRFLQTQSINKWLLN